MSVRQPLNFTVVAVLIQGEVNHHRLEIPNHSKSEKLYHGPIESFQPPDPFQPWKSAPSGI